MVFDPERRGRNPQFADEHLGSYADAFQLDQTFGADKRRD